MPSERDLHIEICNIHLRAIIEATIASNYQVTRSITNLTLDLSMSIGSTTTATSMPMTTIVEGELIKSLKI